MKQFLTLSTTIISIIVTVSGCQISHKNVMQKSHNLAKHQFHHITYVDKSGKQLLAKYDTISETVILTVEGSPMTLMRTRSASGTKYSSDRYVFWSKGQSAIFTNGDAILFKGEKQP